AGSPGSLVAKRFVPFTVPGSPVSAWAAAKASLEGGTAAVHVRVAGVASTFPDASTARTENLWEPDARPVCACGDEQVAKAAPSRLQAKVDPLSLDAKANETDWPDIPDGPDVIVVSGGVVSTLIVVGAETVVLCAASAARAVIATGPLAVPVFHVNVYGL